MSTVEFVTENKPAGGSTIKYDVTSSFLAHREAKRRQRYILYKQKRLLPSKITPDVFLTKIYTTAAVINICMLLLL